MTGYLNDSRCGEPQKKDIEKWVMIINNEHRLRSV